MRKALIAAVAFAVFLCAPALAQNQAVEKITLDKVVEMSRAGLSDETIINAIISNDVSFVLTVKDILYLKNEGVSEEVINFLLRRQPQPAETQGDEYAAEPDETATDQAVDEELPPYVADAAQQDYYEGYNYGDDYTYTDGYYPDDGRYDFIIYHYYGPWLRYYPWYYGFYYYPTSYYYYNSWPDDYYYYFYYPRFTSWRYYYYYPYNYRGYNWGGYYYYDAGRYIKTRDGRFIDRYNGTSARYAVPRGGSATVNARSGAAIRGRTSSGGTAIYRGRTQSSRSPSTTIRKQSTSPSRSIYRSPSTSSRVRSKSKPPSRNQSYYYNPRSSSSTSSRYAAPRSSSPSSRGRSYSAPSSSSRSSRPSGSTSSRSYSSRPSSSSRGSATVRSSGSSSSRSSSSSSSHSSSSSSPRKRH
jgi:hypothetical protein